MLTQDQFNDAIGRVDSADWTSGADARPKMKALNAVLRDMGLDEINSETRDRLWQEGLDAVVGGGPEAIPPVSVSAAAGTHDVTFLRPAGLVLSLRVNGKEAARLRTGERKTISAAAFAVLSNTNDIEYEVHDD